MAKELAYAPQAGFAVWDKSDASKAGVFTAGMATCNYVALVVTDKEGNAQRTFLSHVDANTDIANEQNGLPKWMEDLANKYPESKFEVYVGEDSTILDTPKERGVYFNRVEEAIGKFYAKTGSKNDSSLILSGGLSDIYINDKGGLESYQGDGLLAAQDKFLQDSNYSKRNTDKLVDVKDHDRISSTMFKLNEEVDNLYPPYLNYSQGSYKDVPILKKENHDFAKTLLDTVISIEKDYKGKSKDILSKSLMIGEDKENEIQEYFEQSRLGNKSIKDMNLNKDAEIFASKFQENAEKNQLDFKKLSSSTVISNLIDSLSEVNSSQLQQIRKDLDKNNIYNQGASAEDKNIAIPKHVKVYGKEGDITEKYHSIRGSEDARQFISSDIKEKDNSSKDLSQDKKVANQPPRGVPKGIKQQAKASVPSSVSTKISSSRSHRNDGKITTNGNKKGSKSPTRQ